MNEKSKAEALSRARRIQPSESGSKQIREAQVVLEEVCAEEANLYALRGHGGYIKSEHLEALRKDQDEQVEIIEQARAGAAGV
ncbi:MAG: hypothetical protein ACOYB3_13520 [Azonexus sp.]